MQKVKTVDYLFETNGQGTWNLVLNCWSGR